VTLSTGRPRVYLAGGLNSNWQDAVIAACPGMEFENPRDNGTERLEEYGPLDFHRIKRSELVFAYLEADNPSGWGLATEVGYAYGLGKTVILVNEKADEAVRFISTAAHVTFGSLDEGVAFLREFAR
jgi:nucleoside 2-deoxyribosyltransferase